MLFTQHKAYLWFNELELAFEARLDLPTPTTGTPEPRCTLLLNSVLMELTSEPSS